MMPYEISLARTLHSGRYAAGATIRGFMQKYSIDRGRSGTFLEGMALILQMHGAEKAV